MKRETTRVGVLMGGLATEFDISMKSGKAVTQALKDRGWTAVPIVVGRDLPARLLEEGIDVAWIALHGRFGEDGCVQGLLEVMGIPYTGSGVRASSVAMDKIATKRALQHRPEVRMAKDAVVLPGESTDMPLPVVVKPTVGGSTIGIRLARTPEELAEALEQAHDLDDRVLVEQYIEGDEITCAVLEGRALPLVRILPESGFFDFEAKYTAGKTRYECPAQVPEAVRVAAQRAAVSAYEALGCAGLARADFIVPAQGDPIFLEINTIPGMTATSLSPMAAQQEGMSFPELVEAVLLGAHRMEAERA